MVIPRGWAKKRIDELGEIQAGRQRSPHLTEGVIRPYLRVANVFDGYIDTTDVLRMAFSQSEFKAFQLRNGDILLNEGQSLELVGRSAIFRNEVEGCCFQNTLLRFRPFGDLEPEFMQMVFQHLQYSGAFSRIASRTTSVAHLGGSRLGALKVLIPPRSERRAIARRLELWARNERSLSRLIEKKRRLRRGLIDRCLLGRRPARSGGMHWHSHKLGDLFSHSKSRGRAGLPLFSVTIDAGILRRDSLGRKVDSELTAEQHLAVGRGDLVYNMMRMWQGAVGVAEESGLVSPAYVVCSPREGVYSRFFYHLLKSPRMLKKLRDYSSGLTDDRLRLYFADFSAVPVEIPDYVEQRRIADTLDAIDREVYLLRRQAGASMTQKRAIMARLLTGQSRV